jgi:hypothetical protein
MLLDSRAKCIWKRQASWDEKCCVNLRKYLGRIFVGQWGKNAVETSPARQ